MVVKERRKGKKEIHKNNLETLQFYLYFSLIGSAIQVAHLLVFYLFTSNFSWWNIVFVVFAVIIHLISHKLLRYLSTPLLGPNGELLEAGSDLAESYFSEYAIDGIILTSGLQVASIISNWVWLIWLAIPGMIFYKLWVSLIWPWISSGPPEGGAGDRKEGKKQRQKFKRVQ